MSTSPHAFLTSVLCVLWPLALRACLLPRSRDYVSDREWACSSPFASRGKAFASRKCDASGLQIFDWTKDQRRMAMYSVRCSQPGRRGGDQTRAKRRREGVEFRNKRANRRAPNGARVRLCHRQVLDGSAGHAGAVHGPWAGRKSRFLAGSRGRRRGAGQQPC